MLLSGVERPRRPECLGSPVCNRDAFREKGLLAPKQAGWAGNAAAKLAKPAGGLKVREDGHLRSNAYPAGRQPHNGLTCSEKVNVLTDQRLSVSSTACGCEYTGGSGAGGRAAEEKGGTAEAGSTGAEETEGAHAALHTASIC